MFGNGGGNFGLGGVGMFEEAEGEFYAEDAADRLVDWQETLNTVHSILPME